MESLRRIAGKKDWDMQLHTTVLGYNTSKHSSTQQTPFAMLYGHEAILPSDLRVRQQRQASVIDLTRLPTSPLKTAQAPSPGPQTIPPPLKSFTKPDLGCDTAVAKSPAAVARSGTTKFAAMAAGVPQPKITSSLPQTSVAAADMHVSNLSQAKKAGNALASDSIYKAQEAQKQAFLRRRGNSKSLIPPGTFIMLQRRRKPGKLEPEFEGPYYLVSYNKQGNVARIRDGSGKEWGESASKIAEIQVPDKKNLRASGTTEQPLPQSVSIVPKPIDSLKELTEEIDQEEVPAASPSLTKGGKRNYQSKILYEWEDSDQEQL
jgi:hypothetical protein